MKSITELAKAVGYPMLVFMGTPYVSPELRRLVEAAVAQEREACAKVCEQGLPIASSLSALDDMEMWGEKFAAAIRARSQA